MDVYFPCPKSILYATEALGYIIASMSVFSAATLTYAAHFNSPREMGTYKWYIIANAVCGAGWEVCFAATHLEPLFPAPITLAGGMLRVIVLPDWLYFIGVNAACTRLAGEISSILAMFVYRYCQSATGDVLFGLLRPKQLLITALLLIGVVDLVSVAALNMIVVFPTSTMSLLAERHPDLLQLAYNRTVISFRGIENAWTRSTFVFLEFFCGVFAIMIACCVYGSYSALRSTKSTLSPRTLRLYKSLVNSLVLDLAFCLLLGATPIMVVVIAYSSYAAWASTATVICLTVAGFYPLATHILWLLYITPYRRSVRRLLCRNRQKNSPTTTLFVAVG